MPAVVVSTARTEGPGNFSPKALFYIKNAVARKSTRVAVAEIPTYVVRGFTRLQNRVPCRVAG